MFSSYKIEKNSGRIYDASHKHFEEGFTKDEWEIIH
jgi:hypothetical protein